MNVSAAMISIQDVEQRVASIADSQDDREGAHADEDELYRDVLRAIAEGHPEAEKLAEAALATCDLEFERHCA